jgi:hypothetical protein
MHVAGLLFSKLSFRSRRGLASLPLTIHRNRSKYQRSLPLCLPDQKPSQKYHAGEGLRATRARECREKTRAGVSAAIQRARFLPKTTRSRSAASCSQGIFEMASSFFRIVRSSRAMAVPAALASVALVLLTGCWSSSDPEPEQEAKELKQTRIRCQPRSRS